MKLFASIGSLASLMNAKGALETEKQRKHQSQDL